MPKFTERVQHAWNAFTNNRDPTYNQLSQGSSFNQSRNRLHIRHERSIITSIYNRIAVDCCSIDLKHVRLNQNGRFESLCKSNLIRALTESANIDQTGRALIKDIILSMFDEGVVAGVPTITTLNPKLHAFDVKELRVAKIVHWYPQQIRVEIYNDKSGRKEERVYPKSIVAIFENPFYEVMNEPNSVAQRLIRKLSLMDVVDEQTASGKLDLIFQFPNTIRSKDRVAEAIARIQQLEDQITGSRLGIGYIDGTEKVIQINRSLENNLQKQIEFLTTMLYAQLGITEEIMNGTASEQVMINYINHTIEPIMNGLVDEITRKFLSKTARTQGQAIRYFNDPFKLVSSQAMAELADKFTRNEILSPNEIRGELGYMPSDDPAADELRNRNISQANDPVAPMDSSGPPGMEGQQALPPAEEPKFDNIVSQMLATPVSQIPSDEEPV